MCIVRMTSLRIFGESIPRNQADWGPVMVLDMARVRQQRRNLFDEFSNQLSAPLPLQGYLTYKKTQPPKTLP